MPDFAKYQALGNDYLIIEPEQVPLTPTAGLVRLLCDRHFGIGADGVMFGPVAPVTAGPVEIQIFNADGSACGRSANGLRMFALHLAARNAGRSEYTVRTTAGDSALVIRDLAGGVVEIGLGRPSFDSADVPLLGHDGPAVDVPLAVAGRSVTVTALHNGNPHAVVLVDELSADLAVELGEPIAGHPRFPGRTNVQFAKVIDAGTVQIEIWERGAGYTLASGASACAVVSAAHRHGLVGDSVRVRMPGGSVDVRIDETGAVTMSGPVERVATGHFAPAFRDRLNQLSDRLNQLSDRLNQLSDGAYQLSDGA